MVEISENKLVKINYKGTLDNGTVFDSSEGKDPLEFIFGVGMIIPGLENGIKGLKKGDKKTIKIESKDAYGDINESAVQEVPKTQFPKEIKLEVGMELAAQGPNGVIPVKVKEIKDDLVVVDFNHPLAGKNLNFDIEVIEVRDATSDDFSKFMPQQTHEHSDSCCSSGNCSDEK